MKPLMKKQDPLPFYYFAIKNPHVGNHSLERIELRIKNECPAFFLRCRGGRNCFDNSLKKLFYPFSLFCGYLKHFARINFEKVCDFFFCFLYPRIWQVNLVYYRNDY